MSFSDLGLNDNVLKAVAEAGYTTPTPIQAKAIPYVLMGRDVLGCAQTGTGKTASFTLPMIDILASGRARARMPRSLILAPTRELAAQVSENFEKYGKYCNLSMALLIGGSSFTDQEAKLNRGVDVLIATPGRLIDLFERGKILLADVKVLVIDEADRMLDMGFIPDVERIVGLLPKIRQTLFFSATMAPEIRKLADAFLMNPKEISVDPPASAAETVAQHLIKVRGDQRAKRAALRELIDAQGDDLKSALIFCNRKRDVDVVYRSLERHGYGVAALHGDMAQPVRTETLERFRKGEVRLLVCSDVAARGLDIPVVSHVFNFDVPINSEDYIHRIGRTGRAGRAGTAYMIAVPGDGKFLANVEQMLGKSIPVTTLDARDDWSEAEAAEESDNHRRGRRGGQRKDGERRGSRAAAGPKQPKSGAKSGSRHKRDETVAAGASARPDNEAFERRATDTPDDAEIDDQVEVETAEEERDDGDAMHGGRVHPASKRRSRGTAANNDDTPFGDHTPAFMLRPAKVA